MPFLPAFYLLLLCALLALLLNLKRPSNDRPWNPDMARPPKAEIADDTLILHNVRNIRYGPPGTPYEAVWETRCYDLSRARRLWFVVESFSRLEVVAHTLLSFEFEEGEYLAFSAEARLQGGESYDILRGLFRNFELLYSFGDERDFILRRTNYKDHDVYLYPLTLPPGEVRAILGDILAETNALYEHPRFYNSLTRNCTNLLGVHANHVRPGSFSWWRPAQALPGLSDRLLYRKGWIDTTLPFEELRAVHNVRYAAQKFKDDPEVSQKMREGLLTHRKGQG
jgi:hypothetical protein